MAEGMAHRVMDETKQWKHLEQYAAGLDTTVLYEESEVSLMWSLGNRAIRFPLTAQGREQALDWLEKLEEEEYE